MTDGTQLIVIRGKSSMVLSISRTLHSVSNAESGTDTDHGNRSHAQRRRFAPLACQSTVLQAVLSFFCQKTNNED